MPDRTANWGESQSDAKYQSGDSDSTGGDFIVAQKADGSAELLVWNDTAGQWESGGPVDMGGNDITNAATISADALEAGSATIGNSQTIVEVGVVDHGTVSANSVSVVSVSFNQTHNDPSVLHYLSTSADLSGTGAINHGITADNVADDSFESTAQNETDVQQTYDKCVYMVVE